MKVYISTDIEGAAGVASWEATELGSPEHRAAALEMTNEAAAACRGAIAAGATEIYVKDAHDSGRNMDISLFPPQVRLISDWSLTPDSMIAGLDASFDAVMFVGYHSPAGLAGSPLSHTMNRHNVQVTINGRLASEFSLHALLAASRNVPSVFLSGDQAVCGHAQELVPGITAVPVKEGLGRAVVSLTPARALKLIEDGARASLGRRAQCLPKVPSTLVLKIQFKDHYRALKASFYPGVIQTDDFTVSYTASSMDELMAARMFIL